MSKGTAKPTNRCAQRRLRWAGAHPHCQHESVFIVRMKKLWALATHKTDEAVWMCRLMSFSLAHVSFVGFVVPWSDFLLRPNGRRKTICLHVLVDLKEILPSQKLMFMKTSSSRRRWLFFRKQMGYLHSVLYEVLLGLWSAKVHLLPNMQLQ